MAKAKRKSRVRADGGGRSARQRGNSNDNNTPSALSKDVIALFRQCGYLRKPPASGAGRRAPGSAHRGYEVRFMAHSRAECQEIVRTLKASNIRPGRPFHTANQYRVPVYGRELFEALSAIA